MLKRFIYIFSLLIVPFFTSAQTWNLIHSSKNHITIQAENLNSQNSINTPNNFIVVHYDSDNAGLIGHNGVTFIGGARFRADIMEAYSGGELQFVQFYYAQAATGLAIMIYDAGNDTLPGALLLNQPLDLASLTTHSWNKIKLASDIPVSGNDLWICMQVEDSTAINAPYGISYYEDPDGDWAVDTAGVWQHLTDLGYPCNWNIRGVIKTTNSLASGTYTIGASGDFPSINSAFNTLSIDGISGPVTFELIDALYTVPDTENGCMLNGPIPGADQNSRVTIRPAENKNVTIEGSGAKVLYFVDVSFLTIDGNALMGSSTLKIHSIFNEQYSHNEPVIFYGNSDNNEFKNVTVVNDDYTRGACTIGLYPNTSTQLSPDSNLIENNAVKGGSVGIVIHGYSYSSISNGNIVEGNFIGSETDSLTTIGMEFNYCKSTRIEKNDVQNLRYKWYNTSDTHGIYVRSSYDMVIRNNAIHNIYDDIGPYGSLGLILEFGTGNLVYNNMIYDISSSSTVNTSFIIGILLHQQTNPQIYYNSIYLHGHSNGANPSGSRNLIIEGGCDNIDLKNNIFVNTRDDSPHPASTILDYTDTNMISDHNDLFCTATSPYNYLVGILGTHYDSLEAWQQTGQDLNSISEMPPFVSSDLHIDWDHSTELENNAVPIPAVVFDFDYDPRDPVAPDIGADEEHIVEISQHTHLISYQLEQNYPNPFNPSTKIAYSIPKATNVTIKVYDLIGEEVAVLVNSYKSAGNYEIVFNAAGLPSGVYFYRLKAGDYTSVKKMLLLK